MSNDKESRAAKLTEEHQAQRILDVLYFPGHNKGVFKPANNSLVQKTRGEISGGRQQFLNSTLAAATVRRKFNPNLNQLTTVKHYM